MQKVNGIADYFLKFQRVVISRIFQPTLLEKDSLTYWRVHILVAILLASLVFCTFALAAAIFLAVKEKAWILAIFDVLGYLICISFLFLRGMSYKIRAAVTLLGFYFVGLVVILSVSPLSGGPIWLFTFAVLVGVLLGAKTAIIAVILNGLTVSIIC